MFIKDNPVGSVVEGRVTNITDFSAFVELVPGFDGLIHESKLGSFVDDSVSVGSTVTVRILYIEESERKIGLGYVNSH